MTNLDRCPFPLHVLPRIVQAVAIAGVALTLAGTARADEPAPPTSDAAVRRVELFPVAALEPIARERIVVAGSAAAPRKEARSPALSFGTGDGWKGDAVMTGALVGAFATLVAVCRDGACMLK